MINLKNSLKKALAGAFGVITMLSPLQSCQCVTYFYTYKDIAQEFGFILDGLPKEIIHELKLEAKKRSVTIIVLSEVIRHHLSKYIASSLQPGMSEGDVVEMLLRDDISNHFSLSPYIKLEGLHDKQFCRLLIKYCLYDYANDIGSISIFFDSTSYAFADVRESGKKRLMVLKVLVDYIQQKMSIKDRIAIFFNADGSFTDNFDSENSDYDWNIRLNDMSPDSDNLKYGYKFERTSSDDLLQVLSNLSSPAPRTVRAKKYGELLTKLVGKVREIYEECGATALIDAAELSEAFGGKLSEYYIRLFIL